MALCVFANISASAHMHVKEPSAHEIWTGLHCPCSKYLVQKHILLTWGGEWCIKDACWTSQIQKLLGTWMLTLPLFAEQWNWFKTMELYVAFKDTMSLLLRSLELNYSWFCFRQTINSPQGGSATLAANHWYWCVHCNTLQFYCKMLDLPQTS